MDEEDAIHDEQLPLHSAGDKLRRAREERGMSVEDVANETRIPQRHLELIEDSRFGELPARTYAIGFARTYAKAVGLDDREIAADVRKELATETSRQDQRAQTFEPGDPARVPSRSLAWLSALAVVLLVAGGIAFYRNVLSPGAGPGSIVTAEMRERQAAEAAAARQASGQPQRAAAATGPVVFTSLEDGMWVRFYDGSEDNVLLEKLMAKGERYTVPQDAEEPKIRTGRPDAFAITVGGRGVPKLAEDDFVMSDQPIDAAALTSRPAPGASPAPAASATPAA